MSTTLREAARALLDLEDGKVERTPYAGKFARDALRAALATADADEAAALKQVRVEERERCARLVEEYRDSKPKPRRHQPDVHPAQRWHDEYLRGTEEGERSALYSAACRIRALGPAPAPTVADVPLARAQARAVLDAAIDRCDTTDDGPFLPDDEERWNIVDRVLRGGR